MASKFDVQVSYKNEYPIIQTEGYLNAPKGEDLADVAKELMNKGHTNLVINLEKTRLINSIGISILIEIIELLEERGGSLNFCGLTPVIERTFKMMGLAQHAGIHPDEDAAIASFK